MFPKEKYKYFTNNEDTVIAEQTFAGRKYRGKAVASTPDEFNQQVGMDIAAAKCDVKICKARFNYAKERLEFAKKYLDIATAEYEKMSSYFDDSASEYFEASKRLNEIMIQNGCK